jgi:hypothetical protein
MGWDTTFTSLDRQPEGPGRSEPVELVGPHLRVSARVDLGRFNRLADLVNHSRGYVRIQDARLLRRNGEPTPLLVPELYVNQDEISFIAQATASELSDEPADDWATPGAEVRSGQIPKYPRRFVILTPGHAIIGSMDVYRDMTLSNFVDLPDPRFVPLTDVTARSLADQRIVNHFDLLLVNKTQITAMADDPVKGTAVEQATEMLGDLAVD